METITFNYSFDGGEGTTKDVTQHYRMADDVLYLGDVVEAFANFLSSAYGYTITLDYNTHTDVSKQVEE